MAKASSLKKVLVLLLSVILAISTLGANAGVAFAKPEEPPPEPTPKNHVLHSVTYETVYADPNGTKEEAAFLYAIITLHPALKSVKYLKEGLVAIGLWKAFLTIMNREEEAKAAQGYYILEKKVYKAKKTTKTYWGFSQTYIFSSALGEKYKGKVIVIGKTGN